MLPQNRKKTENNQSLKESGKSIKITKSMEMRNNDMVKFEIVLNIYGVNIL